MYLPWTTNRHFLFQISTTNNPTLGTSEQPNLFLVSARPTFPIDIDDFNQVVTQCLQVPSFLIFESHTLRLGFGLVRPFGPQGRSFLSTLSQLLGSISTSNLFARVGAFEMSTFAFLKGPLVQRGKTNITVRTSPDSLLWRQVSTRNDRIRFIPNGPGCRLATCVLLRWLSLPSKGSLKTTLQIPQVQTYRSEPTGRSWLKATRLRFKETLTVS